MGAFFPQPEDPILIKARRFYTDSQIKRAQALTSMPLMAALQYCDNHPLPEFDYSFDFPLSKKDKLKTELKERFSTKTHEAFLNDFKEKSDSDNSCNKYAVFHKEDKFFIPLPCGKWTCHICGVKNARDLAKRMESSEANSWKIKSHITITVADFEISEHVDEYWNHLLTDLKRGGDFELPNGSIKHFPARPNLKFIKVKEYQEERFLKGGVWYRHIHVVFNQHITKYDIIPLWNHVTKAKFNYVEDTHPHNFNAGKYLFKYFTKPEYQDLFTKGERRYSSSRGVIPPRPVKTPSNAWEFMSIEQARNLADSFKEDPDLEIAWKYEKEIDIDALKLRYKIPLMVNDISIKP